jgi:hypothetical protein
LKVALLIIAGLSFLIGSCAGVFKNPDLASGAAGSSPPFHRITFPEVSNHEGLLYSQTGDTGVARLPEHDYYWMQGNFLCLIRGFYAPAAPCDPLIFSPSEKDITRYEDMDSPPVDLEGFLEPLRQDSLRLYGLSACPVELLCAILLNDAPALITGILHYKKRLATGRQILRRVRTFDIIYGYSRMTGPSQRMPGETGEEYLFELRGRKNFKAGAEGGLVSHALTLYGNAPIGSHWLIERIYIVPPGDRNFDEWWKRIEETVLKFEYRAPLPMPEKIF